MRRICSVCKKVFGCSKDGVLHACNTCEKGGNYCQEKEPADPEQDLKGVCDACFFQKFVSQRPECKG